MIVNTLLPLYWCLGHAPSNLIVQIVDPVAGHTFATNWNLTAVHDVTVIATAPMGAFLVLSYTCALERLLSHAIAVVVAASTI